MNSETKNEHAPFRLQIMMQNLRKHHTGPELWQVPLVPEGYGNVVAMVYGHGCTGDRERVLANAERIVALWNAAHDSERDGLRTDARLQTECESQRQQEPTL